MTRFGIDAPTLLHLVRTGTEVHPDHQLVSHHAVRSRADALLYDEVVRGELDEADALALAEALTRVAARLLGDRVSRRTAWQIAREQGWEHLGDAEVLAVTRLQADALVTVDRALRRRAVGLVPVARLEALTRPG